jgi:serine/threonine protein kinase/Flp pilus assembly protein TadD
MGLDGLVVADRYTILREIGRGGMATVWLADDQQHGRQVAIKTLHPELAGAIGTDRFLREIRLTAQLQHPGIVPILDSGALTLPDGTGVPWYAMPFLDGESLRTRLTRDTQLPIDESLRITGAVVQALAAAHAKDIVHRDIKPENIFLSGEHVYVVDFGVARAVAMTDADRLTSTGLAIGTPAYMSPEQAMAGPVDARSDQYSLAATLYEMLAGEPPFSGPNPQATLARRLAEPARPLSTVRSTIPVPIERATLRALERTPADRFPSVSAFLSALHAPPMPAETFVRQSGGRRRAAVIGGLAMVASVAAWTILSSRKRSVDPEVTALYQRGVQSYERGTPAGAVEALSTLNAAIQRDSSYAPAWNVLAKTYVRAYQRGFQLPEIPHDALLPRAIAAVDRSLAHDASNADAWTTHGMVSQQVDPTNLAPALRSIRRSIAIDSTQATAWHFLGLMTADSGDIGSALEAWRRSIRLDPSYEQALAFLALGHYWRGNYDSAAVWADSAVKVSPNNLIARRTSAVIAVERGRFDEAAAHADAAALLSDGVEAVNSMANQALVKARAGNPHLARAVLLGAEVRSGGYQPTPLHTAINLAEVLAAVGDLPGATRALGRYGTPRDVHFQLHLRCSPTFTPLERDSAFRAMLVMPRPAPGQHCR